MSILWKLARPWQDVYLRSLWGDQQDAHVVRGPAGEKLTRVLETAHLAVAVGHCGKVRRGSRRGSLLSTSRGCWVQRCSGGVFWAAATGPDGYHYCSCWASGWATHLSRPGRPFAVCTAAGSERRCWRSLPAPNHWMKRTSSPGVTAPAGPNAQKMTVIATVDYGRCRSTRSRHSP
jgi:hypothetical protein